MADETTEKLGKELKDLKREIDRAKQSYEDFTDSVKRSGSTFGAAAVALADQTTKAKELAEELNKARKAHDDKAVERLQGEARQLQDNARFAHQLGESFMRAGDGVAGYGDQFESAFRGMDTKNAGAAGFFVQLIKGYDDATTITRKFKGAAIDVGTAFGQSFSEIQPQFSNYASAVRLAQNYTYQSRDAIEQQTKALALMGISMQDMTKTTYVGGTAQNMLSEGFLLASDTGLNSQKVFELMATSARKMGITTEDAGRPLLALQAIARSTGLPMEELSSKIFSIAERYARFGTTVDSLSPIVRRFTDVLGEGFKGLAIQEVQNLIEGLGRQVNTTQGAFMAMQSGMTRPGTGVAGALLDFEDAMSKPEEAMKMLATSLGSIGGGKILKFEEAKAGGEATATQFKIQRDMLTQLTGINDPQQTRTLLAILADVQSGRQVTQDQKETLDGALKSGQQKQDEKATAAERLMKVMVGLQTDMLINLARLAETKLPSPQAQAAGFSIAGMKTEDAARFLLEKAEKVGSMLPGPIKEIAGQGNELIERGLNAIEPGPELRGVATAPEIGKFYRAAGTAIPEAVQPTAEIGQPSKVSDTSSGKVMTVIFRGEGELMQALAKAAKAIHVDLNHGR